jgi:aminopeptidase YwaD
MKGYSILFLLVFPILVFAQDRNQLKANLKQHISYLAADSLKGRFTGSEEEKKSATYIIGKLQGYGATAKGSSGFLQPFTFTSGKKVGAGSYISVNKVSAEKDKGFALLPFSASGKVSAKTVVIPFDSIKNNTNALNNCKKKIVISYLPAVVENNPHRGFDEIANMRTKAELLTDKGAKAFIIVLSDTTVQNFGLSYEMNLKPAAIPALLVTKKALGENASTIKLNAQIEELKGNGNNVVAYIDNGAENTVVLGAHYDHLGMGDEKHSLYRGNPAVHNGADDNASGVATITELTRLLKASTYTHNNYLIIAFSGEELGLYGSKWYVEHPTIDLSKVNYMLNFDMVGRIDTGNVLIVNGAGTSTEWKKAFDNIHVGKLRLKTTESGVGPSDHTSFYLKSIPVIHFFSGQHKDYHSPSDDEEKINYEGMADIIEVVMQTIAALDTKGKIPYVKTKEDNNENAPRFTVTLGVVPDYTFEGTGMRIDGVSEGKAASHAGLKAGDVVIQLGEIKVVDMMSYMQALSKFNKGDTTKVIIKRGTQTMEKEIQF